jgi:hypothetical protein
MTVIRSTRQEDPQMNALELFLTASAPRPCDQCRYARASAHDGLYCHRDTVAPYPCAVERASSPIEAWLYGACGTHGRFFEARTAPAWAVEEAAGRGAHAPSP